MFKKHFDDYACEGDKITCEVDGLTITARIERDDDYGAPWEEDDGHGIVSNWTSRDKKPGERVLKDDRGSKRYYDFEASIAKAKKEGWGPTCYRTGDGKLFASQEEANKHADAHFRKTGAIISIEAGTKGDQATLAVERDFKAMKAWCNDEWFWCGIVLSVEKNGVVLAEHAASLWGIDCNYPGSDNSYLMEVANDLLKEAVNVGKETLELLAS